MIFEKTEKQKRKKLTVEFPAVNFYVTVMGEEKTVEVLEPEKLDSTTNTKLRAYFEAEGYVEK